MYPIEKFYFNHNLTEFFFTTICEKLMSIFMENGPHSLSKTVLLRDRKRDTAHAVVPIPSASYHGMGGGGGVYSHVPGPSTRYHAGGGYPLVPDPSTKCHAGGGYPPSPRSIHQVSCQWGYSPVQSHVWWGGATS